MKTRLITAGVGIVLCLALLFIGSYFCIVLNIAISIVSAILCGELPNAKELLKKYHISAPCIAFSFLMPFSCYIDTSIVLFYIYTLVFFILMVIFHEKAKFDEMFFAFSGTTLITLSMAAFSSVACHEFGNYAFWVVLTLGVPWLADSGAYFAGMLFGKHKLCPTVSPKKTIEGAVGGLICGALGAVLIGYIFSLIYAADMSIGGEVIRCKFELLPLIIVGLINPIISIFGDLTFSVIKRACGIKDFGSIMPGHGGLLDRFDSVIFCTPLVFFISQYTEILYFI